MFIFYIITFGDRKMKEKNWKKNQAGDDGFSDLREISGKNRNYLSKNKGEVNKKC